LIDSTCLSQKLGSCSHANLHSDLTKNPDQNGQHDDDHSWVVPNNIVHLTHILIKLEAERKINKKQIKLKVSIYGVAADFNDAVMILVLASLKKKEN
jgi:hypothetical protein